MRHDFRSDLPKGHVGERVLHEMQTEFLTRTDGKKGDFLYSRAGITPAGKKKVLELKSEISYSAGDPDCDAAKKFREVMRIPPPPREADWKPTPNLFVERYSSIDAGSPGGPWQAQEHGAEYYVHLFFGDGAVFAYRTDDMVAFMEENMSRRGYKQHDIRNHGYITVGFAVPRAHVAHLEIDLFPVWTPAPVGSAD